MDRITRNTRRLALIAAIILLPGVSAPARTPLPKSSPQPPKAGSGKLSAGIITGHDWIITFMHMRTDWYSDTDLANQLGLQEIFHPVRWNSYLLVPSIMVGFSKKDPGVTLKEEMARDAKNLREQFPYCQITTAQPFKGMAPHRASFRIFTYQHGWDKVIYSDSDKVIFLTTLHCENAAQCRPFEPMFEKLSESLVYHGNMKIFIETK